MTDPLVDPTAELNKFFSIIWGENEGFVYLPTKDAETQKWKKVFFEWPKHREFVVQHVLSETATKKEVYFAPAIFKETDPHKTSVKGSQVVWIDYDGKAPERPSEALTPSDGTETPTDPQRPGDGADGPGSGIPEPAVVVQSSLPGHEHAYWVLDEFVEDISFIDNTNRALAYKLGADTSGWDANQILRPPFTHNYKRDKPVTIKEFERGRTYAKSEFSQLPAPEQVVSSTLDTDNLPALDSVIAKYYWPEEYFDLFKRSNIEQGQRSSALMRMAYFCCEAGMSDGEAYAVIENADSRWGKFKDRSDRRQRLLDCLNVARIKHPHALGDSTFAGLLGAPVEVAKKLVYGFEELLNSEFKIEWAIEGLLEMQGIGMVTALPSVGKTQFTLRLAIACALGKAFLWYKPTKKMKVTFFSLEMNHPAIKSFIQTMAQSLDADDIRVLDQNLKIVPLGESLPLDTQEGRAFFENVLQENKPDGVFIDSMGKVTYSELTEEKKIKELNGYYAKIRAAHGCFLWFIHHNRKPNGDNKKPKSLADLYGNQYIAAEASVVLNLWAEEDGGIEVSAIKTRLMAIPKPYKIKRTNNLEFYISEEAPTALVEQAKEVKNDTANVNGKPSSSGNSTVFGI